MSIDRLERVNALLRREIGAAFYKVFAGDPIDLAAVTVTHVETSRNLRHAQVSLSIFGHEDERGVLLRKIANRADEFQRIINQNMTLKYTPKLRFKLDDSVAKGDHVLGILNNLDVPEDE